MEESGKMWTQLWVSKNFISKSISDPTFILASKFARTFHAPRTDVKVDANENFACLLIDRNWPLSTQANFWSKNSKNEKCSKLIKEEENKANKI